ncbi:hypothetical protein F5Y10DRAFT_228749 [Nemania abortiva]|nr:hypothetical protein F5Y10DRAFT_228749 [Nemania abortiva]
MSSHTYTPPTFPSPADLRAWLRTACASMPDGRSALHIAERYCMYILYEFGDEVSPEVADFNEETDAYIRELLDHIQEPVTPEFVFLIITTCIPDGQMEQNMVQVLLAAGIPHGPGEFMLFDYLVSRYKKITDGNREVQSLANVIENFSL